MRTLEGRRSRRAFLQATAGIGMGLLSGCANVFPPVRPPKVPRVGVLAYPDHIQGPNVYYWVFQPFRNGLRERGWRAGDIGLEEQNLALEWRYAEQSTQRLAELAKELVDLPVDVLFTPGLLATRAAMEATPSIPIVGITNDPVGSGLVASLARPGGNLTGVATPHRGLNAKRVELLKQAIPDLGRVAVLWNPLVPDAAADLAETQAATGTLGIEGQGFEVRAADDLSEAIQAAAGWRAEGVISLLDRYHGAYPKVLQDRLLANALPAIGDDHVFVMHGGLMSYGLSPSAVADSAASYVDHILRGAKPAELAIQALTRVELWFNLNTARALGRTIPPSLLARAEEVDTSD
jgi:putative ABC transport system substrate-binding protein